MILLINGRMRDYNALQKSILKYTMSVTFSFISWLLNPNIGGYTMNSRRDNSVYDDSDI